MFRLPFTSSSACRRELMGSAGKTSSDNNNMSDCRLARGASSHTLTSRRSCIDSYWYFPARPDAIASRNFFPAFFKALNSGNLLPPCRGIIPARSLCGVGKAGRAITDLFLRTWSSASDVLAISTPSISACRGWISIERLRRRPCQFANETIPWWQNIFFFNGQICLFA